jgi:hypothetical protein
MNEQQRARAIEQLYANSDLRSELTDDEAAPLLQWGEAQIGVLAGRGLDDAAFAESLTHLQAMMAGINRYVGSQSYLPPDELQTLLDDVAAEARWLGADVPGEMVMAQSADESSRISTIRALTGLLSPRGEAPPKPPSLPEWPDSHG